MSGHFFKDRPDKEIADIEDAASAPKTLALPISPCDCLHVKVAGGLLAVQYTAAPAIIALVSLSSRTVFTVLSDIFALASVTGAVFCNHSVRFDANIS